MITAKQSRAPIRRRRRTHAEQLGAPACGALLFLCLGVVVMLIGRGRVSPWGMFEAAAIGGLIGCVLPRAVDWFPDRVGRFGVRHIDTF